MARNPTNFLEALLAAHGEDGSQFTDDEIIATVFTMLLAGEDTTANTIAWGLFFLNEHPDVRRALRGELDAALEPSGLLRDMQQARQLPYLDAVIRETMRLKPVAPVFNFTANEDVELDGLAILRGTPILGLARVGVLDESAFEDAQVFRPERWLAQDSAAHPHNHPAYIPFGGGPRLCPGRNLALLEMKTALAMICHTFDLSRPDQAAPVTEHLAFTMMPAQLMLQLGLLYKNSATANRMVDLYGRDARGGLNPLRR